AYAVPDEVVMGAGDGKINQDGDQRPGKKYEGATRRRIPAKQDDQKQSQRINGRQDMPVEESPFLQMAEYDFKSTNQQEGPGHDKQDGSVPRTNSTGSTRV